MYTVFHVLKLKSKISHGSEGVRSSDHVRSNRFLIGLNFLVIDRLYLVWKKSRFFRYQKSGYQKSGDQIIWRSEIWRSDILNINSDTGVETV